LTASQGMVKPLNRLSDLPAFQSMVIYPSGSAAAELISLHRGAILPLLQGPDRLKFSA